MVEETQVTLIAVGDIMLGNHPLCIGRGVGAKIKKRGATFPFLKVSSTLKEGDVVFGNLEAVLSDSMVNKKSLGLI